MKRTVENRKEIAIRIFFNHLCQADGNFKQKKKQKIFKKNYQKIFFQNLVKGRVDGNFNIDNI